MSGPLASIRPASRIIPEARFGAGKDALLPGELADVEDALRMVEQAVGVRWIARQQFGGRLFGGRIGTKRRSAVVAQVPHLADQHQRPGAAAERIGIEPAKVLLFIIGERALAHGVEHVEPPHWLQLLPEVGQHELDEPVGLGALAFGFAPALHGEQGEHRHQRGEQQRKAGQHREAALAPGGFALHQLVERQPGEAGDQFQPGELPVIRARPDVGR